jgi:hypothetical protein
MSLFVWTTGFNVDSTEFRQLIASQSQLRCRIMERLAILEKADLPRALACLRERDIPHDPDQGGESVIWLHQNADAKPAAKLLRRQSIRAVHYPWR